MVIDEIEDALMLARHVEKFRIKYKHIRPHGAITRD